MEQIIIKIFSDLHSKNSKDIKSDCREVYQLTFTANKLTDILEKNKLIFQSKDLKVISDVERIDILKELDTILLELIKHHFSTGKSISDIKNDIISSHGIILEDEQLTYYLNTISHVKDHDYSLKLIVKKILCYVNFKNHQYFNYNDLINECKNFKLNLSERTMINILINISQTYFYQGCLTCIVRFLDVKSRIMTGDSEKDILEEIDTLFYNLVKSTVDDSDKNLNIKWIQNIIANLYGLILEDSQISYYLDKIKQNNVSDKSLLNLLITDPDNITSTTIKNISKSLDLEEIRVATKLANIGYRFKLRNSDFKSMPTTKKDIEEQIDEMIRDCVQDVIDYKKLIELCNDKTKLLNGTEEDFNILSDKYFCKYMEVMAKLDGKDINYKVKNLTNISKDTDIELLSLIMYIAQ